MKHLVFMGTGAFALAPLQAIYEHFADRCRLTVFTKAQKPAGRGMKCKPGCVEAFAREKELEVFQPQTLKEESFGETFRALRADLVIVASYGLLLPGYVLDEPEFGCVNIHASLLPEYRGAAPINRCLIDGKEKTGITIMQMDRGLDTGDVLWQKELSLAPEETAGTLFEKLASLGAEMIVEAIPLLEKRAFSLQKQEEARATYAAKITATDQKIDWSRPAAEIFNQIRGLSPLPSAICRTQKDGKRFKIIEARLSDEGAQGAPGEIVSVKPRVVVQCGEGALELLLVQPEGKGKMTAADAVNGRKLVLGEYLS